MNAAIFLDRDNTLIYADGDVADPTQVRLLQGVPSAIASLRGLGYKIVVVTNQDGIANGRYSEDQTDAVHMKINEQIGNISGTSIDRFYYCPFHPDAILERYRKDHSWRKPNPGMIQQAGKDLELDLSSSWLISSDPSDIKAGYAAGVRTMLLTHESEDLIPLKLEEIFITQTRAILNKEATGPYFTARSLVEAVRIIAQQRRPDFPEDRVVRDRFGRKIDAAAAKPKPPVQLQAVVNAADTDGERGQDAGQHAGQVPAQTAQQTVPQQSHQPVVEPAAEALPVSVSLPEPVAPLFAQVEVDRKSTGDEVEESAAQPVMAKQAGVSHVSSQPLFETGPVGDEEDQADESDGAVDKPGRHLDSDEETQAEHDAEADGLAAGTLAFEPDETQRDMSASHVVSPVAAELGAAAGSAARETIVSPGASQVGAGHAAAARPVPGKPAPSRMASQPATPAAAEASTTPTTLTGPSAPSMSTMSTQAGTPSDVQASLKQTEPADDIDADLQSSEKLPSAQVQLQRLESSARQILQELRASREVVHEMSFSTVLGLIFQGLAVICLVGALFLGSGSADAFQRWVLVGIMLQLGSIAAILIRR